MKKKNLLVVIGMSVLTACGGSTNSGNSTDSVSVESEAQTESAIEQTDDIAEAVVSNVTTFIEDGIKNEKLFSVNLGLKSVITNKKLFSTLEEYDRFVKLSKEVVDKYRDRINKLIEKETDQEEKEKAINLLKEIDEL